MFRVICCFFGYAPTGTCCLVTVRKLSIAFCCFWKGNVPCRREESLGSVQPASVGAVCAACFQFLIFRANEGYQREQNLWSSPGAGTSCRSESSAIPSLLFSISINSKLPLCAFLSVPLNSLGWTWLCSPLAVWVHRTLLGAGKEGDPWCWFWSDAFKQTTWQLTKIMI